jgi:hypothetical protein
MSDPPYTFTCIHLHYQVTGAVNPEKLERAVRLSEDKYCSVISTLRPGVPITNDFQIILMPCSSLKRFKDALDYALELHRSARKGSDTPYVSPAGVASLLKTGATRAAIAALLYAPEDQVVKTLMPIRQRFGDRVADIVMAAQTPTNRPSPWRSAKGAYLDHLQTASKKCAGSRCRSCTTPFDSDRPAVCLARCLGAV